MSDLILKRCPICIESIPFDRVLFLQCGHKACTACISTLRSTSGRGQQFPECSECRQPIIETPHRVYLSMDEVASNTRDAEQRSKSDSVTSPAISLGTKGLEDQITLFRRWEQVKKENDGLRDLLNALYNENVIAKEKEKKARITIQNEREKSQQLSQVVDNYRATFKEKDREVAKLNTKLEKQDKKKKENHFDDLSEVLRAEIWLAREKLKKPRTTKATQDAREELQRLSVIADCLSELYSRGEKWKDT